MAWDFIKKLVNKSAAGPQRVPSVEQSPLPVPAVQAGKEPQPAPAAGQAASAVEKTPSERTDEELAVELDKISPRILAQARDPEMRKLIIGIYRKMLVDGVKVDDDKEVKKWMKKHPEVLQGGETVKVETFRREEPKVGRNEPCPCGSGRKYKKCCGSGK